MMRERGRAASRVRRPAATAALLAAAAALLALTLAGPVVARPAAPPVVKARPFVCKATVTSVDEALKTLTAKVVNGNRPMKASIGKDVTFTVGDFTVIVRISKDGATVIGLGDLVAGDRVLINGRIDRRVPTAPVFRARLIRDRGPVPTQT